MRLVRNTGGDRVADIIRPQLLDVCSIDVVTPALSVFAVGELIAGLRRAPACRLVLPGDLDGHALLGSIADRAFRNRLQSRWLAALLRAWLEVGGAVRLARGGVPQGALVIRGQPSEPVQALLGAVALTSEGLGFTPGNPLSLIQASETPEEAGARRMVRSAVGEPSRRSARQGGAPRPAADARAAPRSVPDLRPHPPPPLR